MVVKACGIDYDMIVLDKDLFDRITVVRHRTALVALKALLCFGLNLEFN